MIRDWLLLLMEMQRRESPRSLEHCIELCQRQGDSSVDAESCTDLEACMARYRRSQRTKRSATQA
ncbi:hypothetical protein NIES2104_21470 [Leptolyngbya sp. NIES-2104]|nr:hypothetical protein NIES2104_21470 [Leptolyngbya sp. NIES-2104]